MTKIDCKEKFSLARFFYENQIALPSKIIILITIGHFLHIDLCDKFIFISGKQPSGLYAKCIWDLNFLFFYFCVFTLTRAVVMNYILKPSSLWLNVSRGKILRFAEQTWLVIYYSISFTTGLIILYKSPCWKNTSYFWKDYPVWEMEGYFKYYYLLQFAFWIQQPFVLQIEEPRKDYTEYIIHHINTLLLIALSYGCNFTAVGNAVFVCMDLPDLLLSLAKSLHYVGYGFICDLTFLAMVISWIYTRVYYYGRIIWSVFTEPELYVPDFKLDPLNGFWFPHFVKYVIIALMLGLYALIIFWTFMIFRVIIKLFTDNKVTDVRSDDEDDYSEPSCKTMEIPLQSESGQANDITSSPVAKINRKLSKRKQIEMYAAQR